MLVLKECISWNIMLCNNDIRHKSTSSSIMILNDTKVNYNVFPVDAKIHSMRHG